MSKAVLDRGIRELDPLHADQMTTGSGPTARDRYAEMLLLREADLRRQATQELRREASLSTDARREAAHRRLLAWLELDPEEARVLARAYDEAAAALDREAAQARYEAERDAILHGLRFEQFTRLVDLVPWLRSRLGLVMLGAAAREAAPHAVGSAR